MKRVSPVLITLLAAVVCYAAIGCLTDWYRALYYRATAKAKQTLEQKFDPRYQNATNRLELLVAERPSDLEPIRIGGSISTTDNAPGRFAEDVVPLIATNNQSLELHHYFKNPGGYVSEIRIPSGSTNVYELEIPVNDAVDVWLINVSSYQSLAAFEQFHAHYAGTNTLKLVVQLKRGASVSMDFSFVALTELRHYF